jgi:hypothetical protein
MLGDKITREQLFPNGNASMQTVRCSKALWFDIRHFIGRVINQLCGTILPT